MALTVKPFLKGGDQHGFAVYNGSELVTRSHSEETLEDFVKRNKTTSSRREPKTPPED